jgi:hypothetical protein
VNGAQRIGLVVAALAAVEWIAAFVAYRDPLDDAAWRELGDAIATRDDDAPVLLATEWLSPSARMHVPAIADRQSLLRADLHGLTRFHTVGLDDWSTLLERELEGLPAPVLLERSTIGPFVWSSWSQPATGDVLDALVDARLQITSDAGACRGGGPWHCNDGEVERTIVEVDYRPRGCLGLEVHDGTTVVVRWPDAELGATLRGHLGFGNYNARLRDDAPAQLRVRIDGEERLRITVSDQEGWRPFAIATRPARADVELEVTAALSGTWSGKTYGWDRQDPSKIRTVCLEARTIGGAR